jgi:hypothetical protein
VKPPHAEAFRRQLHLLRRMRIQIDQTIRQTEDLKSAAELHARLAKKAAKPRLAQRIIPQANGLINTDSR